MKRILPRDVRHAVKYATKPKDRAAVELLVLNFIAQTEADNEAVARLLEIAEEARS